MPNFRSVDRKPKFITVDFEARIVPGTFEHASSALVDQLDLSPFIETYRNDDTGAPAYHPAVLLKVILFGYSRGLISSRAIAAACRQDGETIACSRWPPRHSLPPGSRPACPAPRSTAAPPPPSVCPSSERPCHPRSRSTGGGRRANPGGGSGKDGRPPRP
jgi:hypothetical protein